MTSNINQESILTQQQEEIDIETELDELFAKVDKEREMGGPYRVTKAMWEDLQQFTERTTNWQDFITDKKFRHYWTNWRYEAFRMGERRKVSDLQFYILRLKNLIYYIEGISNYGEKRWPEVFRKANKRAFKLFFINRDDFHKEFGGRFNKKTENYIINPDGSFSIWEDSNSAPYPSSKVNTRKGKLQKLVQDKQLSLDEEKNVLDSGSKIEVKNDRKQPSSAELSGSSQRNRGAGNKRKKFKDSSSKEQEPINGSAADTQSALERVEEKKKESFSKRLVGYVWEPFWNKWTKKKNHKKESLITGI